MSAFGRLLVVITAIGLAFCAAGSAAEAAPRVSTTPEGAGYFMSPGEFDGIASVGATFTVPAITCAHRVGIESLLPGIWIYNSSDALSERVSLEEDCVEGSIVTSASVCIASTCRDPISVVPGDVLEASLVYTAKNTVGTIRNRTEGTSEQVVGPVITSDFTVFVGDEGPAEVNDTDAVPSFTTVAFSSVQINGQYLSDWTHTPFDLKDRRAIQIRTSAIIKNEGFTTRFAHA